MFYFKFLELIVSAGKIVDFFKSTVEQNVLRCVPR